MVGEVGGEHVRWKCVAEFQQRRMVGKVSDAKFQHHRQVYSYLSSENGRLKYRLGSKLAEFTEIETP